MLLPRIWRPKSKASQAGKLDKPATNSNNNVMKNDWKSGKMDRRSTVSVADVAGNSRATLKLMMCLGCQRCLLACHLPLATSVVFTAFTFCCCSSFGQTRKNFPFFWLSHSCCCCCCIPHFGGSKATERVEAVTVSVPHAVAPLLFT